jgi:hypothetical protein
LPTGCAPPVRRKPRPRLPPDGPDDVFDTDWARAGH